MLRHKQIWIPRHLCIFHKKSNQKPVNHFCSVSPFLQWTPILYVLLSSKYKSWEIGELCFTLGGGVAGEEERGFGQLGFEAHL